MRIGYQLKMLKLEILKCHEKLICQLLHDQEGMCYDMNGHTNQKGLNKLVVFILPRGLNLIISELYLAMIWYGARRRGDG